MKKYSIPHALPEEKPYRYCMYNMWTNQITVLCDTLTRQPLAFKIIFYIGSYPGFFFIMYSKYVAQLDSQSGQTTQQKQTNNPSGNEMSDEDQWRKQWNSKPVDELWKSLSGQKDSKSLVKKHLTKELYEKLKDKPTSLGGTLAQCISSGKFCIFLLYS